MTDLFRKEYAPLTDEQKAEVKVLKEKAEDLFGLLVSQTPLSGVNGSKGRYISLAKTSLEESIMWAVKGMTE